MVGSITEAALNRALALLPAVEDFVVLSRKDAGGHEELVCYVVTAFPGELDEWMADAAREAGLGDDTITAVPVSSLPLGPDGCVDVEALEAIPVVDDASIAKWEDEIRAVPHVSGAAVIASEWVPDLQPIHVSEIAPPDRRIGGVEEPQLIHDGASSAPPEPSDGPPSISHGGKVVFDDEAPLTLDGTLRRAATECAGGALKYVRSDGSFDIQSYEALVDDAEHLLTGLRGIGLQPGDRAIFQFDENQDFLTAFWACLFAGVIPVPVPVPPTYSEPNAVTQKLAAAWEMLGRPVVLTSKLHAPELRMFGRRQGLDGFRVEAVQELRHSDPGRKWHRNRPDDVALIMLTSGSTGTPKGVRLTHANLLARSTGSVQVNGFGRDEVTLNWMPLDHVAGILFFHLRDVFLGCDQIHCPTDMILGDPLKWLDLIHEHRCTITFAPNFAYGLVNDRAAQMSGKPWDLSCMRYVLNGAESIVARTARRFMELLIPFGLPASAMWPAWGMSEVSSGVTYSGNFSLEMVKDVDSFVEVGRPIPGVSLRVVDDAAQVVPEGVVGNLEVSGTTLMAGYYDDSLNEEAFTGDGWFMTGDLAVIKAGALTITGRAKDVIIINSVNYYSHELEAVVEEIEGVSTSFVAACAVREPGLDTDQLAIFFHTDIMIDTALLELIPEIRQRCVRGVGANPDYLLPVAKAQIPKTEIGKIQRSLLSERFTDGEFDHIRKRMDLLTRNQRTVPDWFFHRAWQRSDRMRPVPRQASGTCVIFTDGGSLGSEICTELQRRGQPWVTVEPSGAFGQLEPRRFEIDPGNPEHFSRLLSESISTSAPVTHTVHLWTHGGVTGMPAEPAEISETLRLGTFSLLHWIQALGSRQDGKGSVKLLVVSTGVQVLGETDDVDPARATVLGLVKSAPQELPWLTCRHVDLSATDPVATASMLLDEMTDEISEREIAYRQGERFVARLEKAELSRPSADPPLKAGGTYLLTGGLGGIGFEVARFLLERYHARLVIADRSELPVDRAQPGLDSDLPPEDRSNRYRTLESLGDVGHVTVDVGDAQALRVAVEAAEQAWGHPLDGVIHMAGVYEERSVLDQTAETFKAVLHTKVQGVCAIFKLLEDRPDTLFLGFSSVIGFFGGALVSSYASANAALEAAVASGMVRAAAPCVCASWSTWEDVGISRAFLGTSLLRAKGYLPVTVGRGLTSILAALNQADPVTYVGLDATNAQVRRWINTRECGRQRVSVFCSTDAASADSDSEVRAALAGIMLRDRFGAPVSTGLEPFGELPLDSVGRVDRVALASVRHRDGDGDLETAETDLERTIARIWKATLRREQVDVRDNFFDLGGNSLLLSQVSSALSAEIQREVSLTEMFQYTTVRALADYLGGTPSPSEDLDSTIARGSARSERMRSRRRRSRE